MKKLALLALVLAAATFAVRCSAQYALYQLATALKAGDLPAVEQHADVAAFATLPLDVLVAGAEGEAADNGGGLAGVLAGALGSVVTGAVKPMASAGATAELRKRIATRDLASLMGGFRFEDGLGWYGGSQSVAEGTIIEVRGTCAARASVGKRASVSVGLIFTKSPGPVLGYPPSYKATGVEAVSLKALAKTCAFDRPK